MELVLPQWMRPLVNTTFYQRCKNHNRRRCNFFCTDCDTTFCSDCNDDGEHKGHFIFQVFKASEFPGIRRDSIKSFFDISDVQEFSINNRKIAFIKPRPRKAEGNGNRSMCDTCGWDLSYSSYRFCSIKCKVDKVGRDAEPITSDKCKIDKVGKDAEPITSDKYKIDKVGKDAEPITSDYARTRRPSWRRRKPLKPRRSPLF